jgi:hypothetical protein
VIENRVVAAATCDACGHVNYGDSNGFIRAGYGVSIVDYEHEDDAESREAYACRETHIGKASRVVLDKAAMFDPEEPPFTEDAPPLPQPDTAECA